MHNTYQALIDKEYIISWYNFQPCCIAGNRDTAPGSQLSEHPLYINFPYLSLIAFFPLSDEPDGLQTLLGFVKGLDTIPSLGFDQRPRLKFNHPNPVNEYDGYANILTVPVFMNDSNLF